ncbi:hypothetical protein LJC45_04050 [Alistipes sp. OttesenSCG-928-B03]|nr:hypothetical protein [Alistipes sp. OttesenSCG-928-B03]
MKLFKTTLVVIAAATMLTGCLKDNETKFEIGSPFGFVIQQQTGTETFNFSPYIGFYTYGKEKMETGRITTLIAPAGLSGIKTDNFYETKFLSNGVGSNLSLLSSTYSIYAESALGTEKGASITLNYASSDAMGSIEISEFKYENGELSATINDVENADAYGFMAIPEDEDNPSTSLLNAGMLTASRSSDGRISRTLSSTFDYEKVIVVPFAVSSNAFYQNIYLIKWEDRRTISSGATTFDEIPE